MINVDIYSRHWYNNIRWIPYPVSKESPQLGYSITLVDILKLIQHSEVWIYDSNTKRIINLDNLSDYFPDYVPPYERGGGGGGGGDQKTYVVSGTTAQWAAQPTLVSEKDVLYIYTDYITTETGDTIPGIKVGDGTTLVSDLPFTASSSGSSGDKEVYSKTTADWDALSTYIPEKDTLCIYTDHRTVDGVLIPGMKVGDGVTYLKDLPFMDASETVSQEEKDYWNDKVSVKAEVEQQGDDANLIFYL